VPVTIAAEPTSYEEPYRVVDVVRRTPTIVELWLRPLGGALEYLPGEYVLIEDRCGGVPQRSYSLANAPRDDGLISLLVTCVPGGRTSPWVHAHARAGAEVILSGPYGTFVDDPLATASCLLLAAGSGLAPDVESAEAALASGRRRALTVVLSARTEADVLDRDRFAYWEARHPRFRFILTLTGGAGPPPRGRVPALLPTLFGDLSDHDVFVAGPAGFVVACAAAAEALGACRARVHTEAFFVERDVRTPDAATQSL